MALQTYRELRVWQEGMKLSELAYQFTEGFPREERYGLSAQIRSSAVSIPSNIAEGYGRIYRGDYIRHLSISLGSLAELETQTILAHRLRYLDKEESQILWRQEQIVGKQLRRLIQSLQPQNPKP